MKTGYCITTKKWTLRCKHPEWFRITQEYYNQIVFFYYQLLLEHEEFYSLNNQQILRNLEKLTILGKDKIPVKNPLPWKKVPLYFRRAAINTATGLVKSYKNREDFCNPAASICVSVIYYKGMYRDFQQDEIYLKVWNGEVWHWMRCRLSGNSFPNSLKTTSQMEILSPTVVITQKRVFLHVPVKEAVTDIRTAKQRIAAKENICSIQFTNSDSFAVACILDSTGKQIAVKFCKGGKQYRQECSQILKKIQKSEASRGGNAKEGEKVNQKEWLHLKNLSRHYAHQVSKQIVTFCIEQEAKVIVMSKNKSEYSKVIYYSVGNWSPFHLSVRIREFLGYKAWKAGIVILEKEAGNAAKICAICGTDIRKRRELCECKNGHVSNRYLNAAKNLGRMCQEDFQKFNKKEESTKQ